MYSRTRRVPRTEKQDLRIIIPAVAKVLFRFRAVMPPAGIPQALKQRCRVPGNELDVPPDRFLQEFENVSLRMILR
jgi:hypothetical protein